MLGSPLCAQLSIWTGSIPPDTHYAVGGEILGAAGMEVVPEARRNYQHLY